MKNASLRNVCIQVEVVLGETELTVEELAGMGKGTLLELDKLAGEPVALKAAGNKIAEGEVVVIDENYGVRITEIVSDDVSGAT